MSGELTEEQHDEVVATLTSGWLSTGPRVRRFEAAFADYVGAAHAVAVNSCTAALHLALLALEVGPGDEVVTTPMTFCATANVIVHTGATPRFARPFSNVRRLVADPIMPQYAKSPRRRIVSTSSKSSAWLWVMTRK